jgi:hypothetical protein
MTTLPWETPENWRELSSSEEEHDQILFASSESTEDVLLPMKRPAVGEPSIAPSALYLRSITVDELTGVESVKYIRIPNWRGANERLVMCAQFTADGDGGGTTLIAKPRLEAYSSFDAAYTGAESDTPLLAGTDISPNPLIRAVDCTLAAKTGDATFPPSSWFFNVDIGSGDADKKIKYLNGYDNPLACGEIIVPVGGKTIDAGDTYDHDPLVDDLENADRSYFFFSVCPVIPEDILRGQVDKDVILIVRSFYA